MAGHGTSRPPPLHLLGPTAFASPCVSLGRGGRVGPGGRGRGGRVSSCGRSGHIWYAGLPISSRARAWRGCGVTREYRNLRKTARPLWPEPSRPVNPPGHGRPRRPTPRVVDPGQWPSPDWPGWPFRVTGQKNRGSPVNGHPSPPPPPPTAKTH